MGCSVLNIICDALIGWRCLGDLLPETLCCRSCVTWVCVMLSILIRGTGVFQCSFHAGLEDQVQCWVELCTGTENSSGTKPVFKRYYQIFYRYTKSSRLIMESRLSYSYFTCAHADTCTHTCEHTDTYMHACMHTHAHACVHTCSCTHMCMHTHMHTHTYTHTHMHTHTHTHTFSEARIPSKTISFWDFNNINNSAVSTTFE